MLKEIDGKFCRESYENQQKAGRYNPASVFKFTHPDLKITCRAVLSKGDDDACWVYYCKETKLVYAVSINMRMEYCGVEAFEFTVDETRIEARDQDQLFFHSEEQFRDVLGKRGLDLAARTIARRLIDHLHEVMC